MAFHPLPIYAARHATYPVVNPATLSLDVWIDPPYTGSAPWAGEASAGSSANQRLNGIGADPSAGTSVNGYVPATFDGVTQYLILGDTGGAGSRDLSFAVAQTAGTVSILARPTTLAADGGAGNRISNPGLFAQEGGSTTFGLGVSDAGATLAVFDSGLSYKENVRPCPINKWTLIQCYWDGTTQFMRTASESGGVSAWDSIACLGPNDLTTATQVNVGKDFNTSQLTGSVLEIMTSKTVISRANLDGLIGWAQRKYALSLGL